MDGMHSDTYVLSRHEKSDAQGNDEKESDEGNQVAAAHCGIGLWTGFSWRNSEEIMRPTQRRSSFSFASKD